jgi:hypothetical protein
MTLKYHHLIPTLNDSLRRDIKPMSVGHLHRFSKEQIDQWLLNSAEK